MDISQLYRTLNINFSQAKNKVENQSFVLYSLTFINNEVKHFPSIGSQAYPFH